jgi:restriction endonuclease S subunit
MGKTPSRNNPDYWSSNDYAWVSISDMSNYDKYVSGTKEYISKQAVQESGIKTIPANTVIMSFKLSIGKTAITTSPIFSNEAIMAFIDKGITALDPEYIFYLFSGKNWDEGSNKAVMGKTLNKATLSDIEVDIPTQDVQKERIEKLNKISSLIADKKKQLRLLDELIKARFVEMFGNVIVNDKGWPTELISKVAPANSPRIKIDDKVWLLNLDMVESQSGKILGKLIVSKDKINASTCAFDENNVLYSKLRPYLNKVVLPDQEGYCTTELVPLKPSDKLTREFLATLLRSDAFVSYINEKTAGAKMPRVSMNIFRQFECILPPIALQQQFSEFYKQVDKSKFTLSNELAMGNFYIRLIYDRVMHGRIDLRVS